MRTNSLISVQDQSRLEQKLVEFCGELKVVANPRRFKVLLALVWGDTSVSDIESATGIKQPNLSLELRKLRDSGMVKTRKQSKVVFYSLANRQVHDSVIGLACLAGLDITEENAMEYSLQQSSRQDMRNRDKNNIVQSRQGECAHFPEIHRP